MSYAPQVIADSSGQWSGNGLRFATEGEALRYAEDLMWRWTSVTDYRVIESADPITHAFTEQRKLVSLEVKEA